VLKVKRSAAQDLKVTEDDEEDPEPEGDQVPQGEQGFRANPGQRDLLVNMDLQDHEDQWALKGISGCRVTLVPWGLAARRV